MSPDRIDHREAILGAGLAALREQGLAGLTQPKIAAKTGLRQSHLTYYYPTRADLLEAVARRAMEQQIAAVSALLKNIRSTKDAASKIAKALCRSETTRVLAALNQAADLEPAVHKLFVELTKGLIAELEAFLVRLGISPARERVDFVHSLFVGLAIINLATGRADAMSRAQAVFALAFKLLSGDTE
jgi:AcrR family transcriptional regulator